MKKIILTAITACAMVSLMACSAESPANAKPQTEGPTGSLIKYDSDSVKQTFVDKSSTSKPSKPSFNDEDDDDDELDFSDICDGSYTSVDLDKYGVYYYCEDDEEIYCVANGKFTTKCDSDIIDMIDDEGLLY